jgi:hypothetical protein
MTVQETPRRNFSAHNLRRQCALLFMRFVTEASEALGVTASSEILDAFRDPYSLLYS